MSVSGAGDVESQTPSSTDGEKQKPKVTFNMNGQIIFNKNPFKKLSLELAKTHVSLLYDDWRIVPLAIKDDMFKQLQNEFDFPADMIDHVLIQMGSQWRTWKKNIRNKYLKGTTKETILAEKDNVPRDVLVTANAWKMFVEREATPQKLAQREQAKENRSKKTDAHYLGRTSYVEKEAKWTEKRKPDRVDLYVEARKNPKTGNFHPGAIADIEKIKEIKKSQDEASNRSLKTDALTQRFGKDRSGRTRGVGSTVPITRIIATIPIRNELEKVQSQLESNQDMMGGFRQDLNDIMKYIKGGKASTGTKDNGGSPDDVICSEKSSVARSPRSFESAANYYLKSVDGRKTIAIVAIEKTCDGAIVHNRRMLSYEVKVNVIKVLPGMHNEVLWQGTQGGEDNIGGTEGGYLVWPRHLVEEVEGEMNN